MAPRPQTNGTGRNYLIARLKREGLTDYAAAVEAGEISAYAVAVELGWARRRDTLGTGSTNQAKRRAYALRNVGL